MKKKKFNIGNSKIIFIVLCVILVVLIVLGVLSFISYSNKHKGFNDNDYEATVIDENSGEPYATDVLISSSEEFIDYIKGTYYNAEANVVLKDEKDGCYKATGPDGVKYSYCNGANDVSIEK